MKFDKDLFKNVSNKCRKCGEEFNEAGWCPNICCKKNVGGKMSNV